MATIPLRPLSVAKTRHGNSPYTVELPEAASQTFAVGAVLTINSSGYIAEAGADPTSIVGVAAAPGQNGATAGLYKSKIWVADDDSFFIGNLSGSSVTDLRDVGLSFGLVKSGTKEEWYVDKTDQANRRCIIQQLYPNDAVGDTNGRVLFTFLSVNRKLSYTS